MNEKEPFGETYKVQDILEKLKESADLEAAFWGAEDFLRASTHTQNTFLYDDTSYAMKEEVARLLYDELFPDSTLTFITDHDGRQQCWRVAENIHKRYQKDPQRNI